MKCGEGRYQVSGCGHDIDDHNDQLTCRICKAECGLAPHAHSLDLSRGVYVAGARRPKNAA